MKERAGRIRGAAIEVKSIIAEFEMQAMDGLMTESTKIEINQLWDQIKTYSRQSWGNCQMFLNQKRKTKLTF